MSESHDGVMSRRELALRRWSSHAIDRDVPTQGGLARRPGHTWSVNTSHDHLRANAVSLQKGTVLRMDIIGVRLMGEEFMDQVCEEPAILTARRMGAVA